MHYFIFASTDSWISSGSNRDLGETLTDANYGKDEILELKKEYFNNSFEYQTRALVKFNLSSSAQELIDNGTIPVESKWYLRMYEANGTQELSNDYTLAAHPLSQSWQEGTGKSADSPKTLIGASWDNKEKEPGMSAVTWSYGQSGSLIDVSTPGGNFLTGSHYAGSQSFDNASPDIEMDVTEILRSWITGSGGVNDPTSSGVVGSPPGYANHGFLLKFSGSQEHASGSGLDVDGSDASGKLTYGKLKFFSTNTNTIYAPRLEARWDDHKPCTGSNTGSLNALTMSGVADNYLYMKGIKEAYKESERVKFRIGARKRYVDKTFSGSVQAVTASYVPEGSGSYSIVDMATGETWIPFSAYTSMSCDTEGNYFMQYLNAFEPNRSYKILLKLKEDDGQELIFDDNFTFKVRS
tara:strand:+ start:295 stop:1524 length:1230 start_codon:yes stop_codon:yes gene_type:complete